MSPPPLLLLRHGETTWNRAGRLQGAQDAPLTDLGRAQATAQGAILSGFDLDGWSLWSSPQGRAVTTARIALGPLSEGLRTDARLGEIGLGDWAGRLRADLVREAPAAFAGGGLDWYDHAPGGEGLSALADRCAGFLADLAGPAVIVTHGITGRMLRCLALGWPPGRIGALEAEQGVVHRVEAGGETTLRAAGDIR